MNRHAGTAAKKMILSHNERMSLRALIFKTAPPDLFQLVIKAQLEDKQAGEQNADD
jgi:hypothetical protein